MARSGKESGLESYIYPTGSGIRIRELINTTKGKVYGGSYLVDVPGALTGGRRIRVQKSSKDEAEREAEKQYEGAKRMGHAYFALSDQDRAEIHNWLPQLQEAGISFAQAAEFALAHLAGRNAATTVEEFVRGYIDAKKQRLDRGDIRPRSYSDFRMRAERFVDGFGGVPLVEVTTPQIKEWLIGMNVGPRTTKNYVAVVAEIFNEAVSAGILSQSPLGRISRHERKVLLGQENGDTVEPHILTVADAERLLNAADGRRDLKLFPFVVLALFCGLRTEEIKRLNWADINLESEEPSVVISSEIAKKRRIRHVQIPSNAVAWLETCSEREGPVALDRYSGDHARRFLKLTREAGFGHWDDPETQNKWISTWKNNCMRHSFGSYHYALHGDAISTSRLLGHKSDDTVLFDHYRALATKAEAENYFNLLPVSES